MDWSACRLQPVRVPHWVRGQESAEMIEPGPQKLSILGLGRSVGTPREADHRRRDRGRELRTSSIRCRRRRSGARSFSTTCRSPRTARPCATAAKARKRACRPRSGGGAGALGGTDQPAHPAHGRHGGLRGQLSQDPRRRGSDGGRDDDAPAARSRRARARPPEDGSRHAARCALAQRHRRAARPRAPGGDRGGGRSPRLLGRRARARTTTAAAA